MITSGTSNLIQEPRFIMWSSVLSNCGMAEGGPTVNERWLTWMGADVVSIKCADTIHFEHFILSRSVKTHPHHTYTYTNKDNKSFAQILESVKWLFIRWCGFNTFRARYRNSNSRDRKSLPIPIFLNYRKCSNAQFNRTQDFLHTKRR